MKGKAHSDIQFEAKCRFGLEMSFDDVMVTALRFEHSFLGRI